MSETWQAIIQLILLPTSIVAVLAFVMRELFRSYLSMDVERYKAELQNDLESHKARLKSESDARQFEFQTKFSLLHQQRAEIVSELFSMLVKIEEKINAYLIKNEPEEDLHILIADFRQFQSYFGRNCIYFDEDMQNRMDEIEKIVWTIIGNFNATKFIVKKYDGKPTMQPIASEAEIKMLDEYKKFQKIFPEVKKLLKNDFRQILFVGMPDYQLEKKQ